MSREHVAIDPTAALRDLSVLASPAMQGRETGEEGNTRARDFILDRLREAGIPPLGSSYEHPFFWFQQDGVRRHGVNVLAQLPGGDRSDRVVVVSAHYDHLGREGRDGEFSGADDNASGVAAVLEVARPLRTLGPRCSVVFAFFDGEEAELRGSRAFVLQPPVALDRIVIDVNVDMVGRAKDGNLWIVGTRYHPALREVLEPVLAGCSVAVRFGHDRFGWVPALSYDWTEESDHAAFHGAGIPFVYLGTANDPETHSTSDTTDTIDETFFGGALGATLETVLAMDTHFAGITGS